MSEVFEVNGVKVYVAGELVAEMETLTVEELKRLAKQSGIKKFTAEKEGRVLGTIDFPVTEGTVTIKAFYEAK